MSDDKTSPGYYKKGGMECREAIKAATSNLTGEEAYNVGCAIKYLWRFKEKNGVEDLKKASQYIDFLIGDPAAAKSPFQGGPTPGDFVKWDRKQGRYVKCTREEAFEASLPYYSDPDTLDGGR